MSRRSPLLGAAIGIDGCPGGWVSARLDGDEVTWDAASITGIAALLDPIITIGIDMPIGLLDRGTRECDALARRALPGAASRVFATPPRPVLALGPDVPNAQVQDLSRELTGGGVSRQALNLAPRILALDAALADLGAHCVIEVHPELAFAALAGRVLARKKSPEGAAQRMDALSAWLPRVDAIVAARPPRVPVNDALDALAALWSAVRWRDGAARTLPEGAGAPPFIAV